MLPNCRQITETKNISRWIRRQRSNLHYRLHQPFYLTIYSTTDSIDWWTAETRLHLNALTRSLSVVGFESRRFGRLCLSNGSSRNEVAFLCTRRTRRHRMQFSVGLSNPLRMYKAKNGPGSLARVSIFQQLLLKVAFINLQNKSRAM